jgi:hypothetical protein
MNTLLSGLIPSLTQNDLDLPIFTLITSSKTLIPNQVAFQRTEGGVSFDLLTLGTEAFDDKGCKISNGLCLWLELEKKNDLLKLKKSTLYCGCHFLTYTIGNIL